jgi:chaperonin GroEL (HSP60 family)
MDVGAIGVRAVTEALRGPLKALVEGTNGDFAAVAGELRERTDAVFDVKKGKVVNASDGPLDPFELAPNLILRAAHTAAMIVRTRSWAGSGGVDDPADGDTEATV